jgi:hypothetical protein
MPRGAGLTGEVPTMTTPRTTIVAVTSDEPRHAAVLDRAAALAAERNARVILFDLDADLGPLESPLPTAWSGDGEEEQFGNRLDVGDLEAAGQARLADRVRALRAAGIEAMGWLPPDAGAAALADYAADQGAELVLLSTEDVDLVAELESKTEEPDRDDGGDRAASKRRPPLRVETVPPA